MKNPLSRHLKTSLLMLLIVVLATTTAWVFHNRTYQSLSNDTMDIAQIARSISEGHGFSTDVLQPIGTAPPEPLAPGKYYPELRRAPLFPILLGGAYAIGGVRDVTVTTFTILLFTVSAVQLFVLAQRLLRNEALALATTAAYIISISVLAVAGSGQPPVLGTCLLLALLLTLTPRDEEAELAKQAVPVSAVPSPFVKRKLPRHFITIGIWAALCYLNDYSSLFYLLPLLWLWPGVSRKSNWLSVLVFCGTFALVSLPWWIRNLRLTGNPFTSSELLLLTGQVEGVSGVWVNLTSGLSGFFYNAVTVPHLLLAPFIVISLWIRPADALLARRKVTILLAALLSILALCALGRTGAAELVPLAPLLALVGLTTFHQIMGDAWTGNAIGKKIALPLRFEQVGTDANVRAGTVTKAYKFWQIYDLKFRLMSLLRLPVSLRKVEGEDVLYAGKWTLKTVYEARAILILLAILFVPLLSQVAFTPKATPIDLRAALQPLTKVVAQDKIIITDIPQAVAWYANRNVWPVPSRATQIFDMDENSLGAIFLANPATAQRLPEWTAAYNRAEIPGFENVPMGKSRDVFYLKQPSVTEVQKLVKDNAKDGKSFSQLGQTLLRKNDYQGALKAFQTAQSLQPTLTEAFVGGGYASLNLRQSEAAKQQMVRALQLDPRSLPALLGMAQISQGGNQLEQATGYYEKVLADAPNQPVALNNLAEIYARPGGNLYRALEMARRAAAQNPNNGSILDTVGWTCYRLGYYKEALAYLRQAAKLSPQNKTITQHLQQAEAKKEG